MKSKGGMAPPTPMWLHHCMESFDFASNCRAKVSRVIYGNWGWLVASHVWWHCSYSRHFAWSDVPLIRAGLIDKVTTDSGCYLEYCSKDTTKCIETNILNIYLILVLEHSQQWSQIFSFLAPQKITLSILLSYIQQQWFYFNF